MPTFPSDAADKFVVRFPNGMRDQISAAAKASGRTMNAEIVDRLLRSLDQGSVDDLRYVLLHMQASLASAEAKHQVTAFEAGSAGEILRDVFEGRIGRFEAPDPEIAEIALRAASRAIAARDAYGTAPREAIEKWELAAKELRKLHPPRLKSSASDTNL